MKLRKLVYSIHYYHVLNFSIEYRNIISPFFSIPNLQYGVDNPNTIEERIRLVFPNDKYAISCNMDTINLIYEGDENGINKSSSEPLDTLFDVFKALCNIVVFAQLFSFSIH